MEEFIINLTKLITKVIATIINSIVFIITVKDVID